MVAYFTASIIGKKYHLAKYKKIIELLESKGVEVICEHIINTSETQIRLETRKDRLQFHQYLEDWITTAQFVVAETSFPSISVGYEISLAIARGKPTLVLYSEGDPPSLLAHHESEKVVCERYTETTLPAVINDFFLYAHGGSDTRFTFFISSKQAAYLEKRAKTQHIPKSVYLRHLIDTDMHHRDA